MQTIKGVSICTVLKFVIYYFKTMDERLFRLYFLKYTFILLCSIIFIISLPLLFLEGAPWSFYVAYLVVFIYFGLGIYIVYRQRRIGTLIYAGVSVLLELVMIVSGTTMTLMNYDTRYLGFFFLQTSPLTIFTMLVSVLAFEFHRLARSAAQAPIEIGVSDQVLFVNSVSA